MGLEHPAKGSGKKVIAGVATVRSDTLCALADLAEAGEFLPVIDRSYPLESAGEAHAYVDSGRKRGNVVLTVARPAASHAFSNGKTADMANGATRRAEAMTISVDRTAKMSPTTPFDDPSERADVGVLPDATDHSPPVAILLKLEAFCVVAASLPASSAPGDLNVTRSKFLCPT